MREQLLAANNLVMGTTNILVIGLPDEWRMLDGHAKPELDHWSEYRDRRWMRQGFAPYRLVAPHPDAVGLIRAEVELLIQAKPLLPASAGPAPGAASGGPDVSAGTVQSGRPVTLEAGHKGTVTHGAVKRGVLPRREAPALWLEFDCIRTARRLRVELAAGLQGGKARATAEDLETLLEVLVQGIRCH